MSMTPRYFDVHAHTQFATYGDEAEALVRSTVEGGTWVMNVGTQLDTSRAAVAMANRFTEGVYATVGLHPLHTTKSFHDEQELGGGAAARAFTSRGEVFDAASYRALALDKKTVAIGECGLDYFHRTRNDAEQTRIDAEDTKKRQVEAFEAQIAFANEVGKPLMLHIRDGKTSKDSTGDAYRDALAILRRDAKVRGNVHFFAGSMEIAKQFLELGFTLSFTGVLTFTRDYDEVVRYAPLDMLLSETDSPYIAPVPYRGKRNEPGYVAEVVRAIARIRGEDEGVVGEKLVQNARRVFGV